MTSDADHKPSTLAHRSLPLLLLRVREELMGRFRPILNAHGVTEQQWRIVRALLATGPMEPRQIGDVCRISSPSLAGMLARMDDLGLIVRQRVAADQRRLLVSLTPKSRGLARRMAPFIDRTYDDIEARLGTAFIERSYAVLDELLAALEGADTSAATGAETGADAGAEPRRPQAAVPRARARRRAPPADRRSEAA